MGSGGGRGLTYRLEELLVGKGAGGMQAGARVRAIR